MTADNECGGVQEKDSSMSALGNATEMAAGLERDSSSWQNLGSLYLVHGVLTGVQYRDEISAASHHASITAHGFRAHAARWQHHFTSHSPTFNSSEFTTFTRLWCHQARLGRFIQAIHPQAALHGPAVPVLSPGLAGHHSTILETLANLPENAFNEAANGGHTFAIKSERFWFWGRGWLIANIKEKNWLTTKFFSHFNVK